MRRSQALWLTLLVILNAALSAKLPVSWMKCPKTGNEECLKTSIRNAIVQMKNGNKGLSVLPLDPLHFERMEIQQGGSSPVNINLTFYQTDMLGHGSVHLTSARADWDNYEIEFGLEFEEPAFVIGDYSIEGRVLVLPIQGKGKSNITLEGLRVNVALKGSEVIKNSKRYMKIDQANYLIEPKKMRIWLGNLFNGVPSLGDNMNKFLNDNWEEIVGELKGTISGAMGQAVLQIANAFFLSVPLNQLYKS